VQLHPVRACGAANVLESLVDVEPVTLGKHALGLLDRDARLQGLLELCAPLVCGLGDGQESADRGHGLVGTPCSKGVNRLLRGVLVHAGDLIRPERPFWATLNPDRGRFASRGVSRGRSIRLEKGMQMPEGSQREARAARNELVFRAVNEQIVKMTDRFRAQLSDIDIVCECANTACVGTIRIDVGEFAKIERAEGAFLVLPGHEDESVEQVVDRREPYVVVWKPVVSSDGGPPELT
jgi:hypothetical protein